MLRHDLIEPFLSRHPQPLLFVTVSGAHLYGFPSADSDYDLRGSHVTPAREVLRLSPPNETIEVMDKTGPVEMDIVTHDVRKFFALLLKNNGYVLEQIFSPMVVCGEHSTDFAELRSLARGCITRHHNHHYRNFAQNQWEMVVKGGKPTVKGLLYTYRVLLAGIHLLRTGEVESNIVRLNERFRLAYIDDLIAAKVAGAEKQPIVGLDLATHEREFLRLRDELEAARENSTLPDEPLPAARAGLDDMLVRLRLRSHQP
jgi:uncharacterized protein